MNAPDFRGRREDARLVRGGGRYTADVDLPGQLYGHFVRADRAHARILSIDTAAARAHPGVVAVFTGADAAELKGQGTGVPMPGRDGQPIIVPPFLPFARDRVRHVGQEVALVVAQTRAAAQDAAEAVLVDYEELPVVATLAEAARDGAPQVHPEAPGNRVFDWAYGDEAATAAAFEAAPHVVRLRVASPRVCGVPMEPRACTVHYDPQEAVFHVYVPHQGMAGFRPGMAHSLGVAPEKIHVHALDVGAGFGIRTQAYCDHVILAWAAQRLGRPVKWVSSRTETFATDHQGRGVEIEGELAFDDAGQLLAMRTLWRADEGAFLSSAGPNTNMQNGFSGLGGVYRMQAAFGRHLLYLTHLVPHSPYRGAGRPEAAYIVERLVDEAAHVLRMDRAEIRRRNFIPREAYPYRNPAGCVYDSGDPAALLERALGLSGWQDFAARRAQSEARGMLRGIGMASFVEPSGGGAIPKDQVAVRIDAEGGIVLYSASQSHGQSHETTFPRLVARILGVPEALVRLETDHAMARTLIGNPVVGSRSMMLLGSAFKSAGEQMVAKGTELAARRLEAAPQDLEFSLAADGTGSYAVKGTDRRITMSALIREAAGGSSHPLDTDAEQAMVRAFPTGVHVAEVEIDPQTGVTRVLRYIAVDDCGMVFEPVLATGQVHGGVVQQLGQVLGEQATYDPQTGQLLSASFMDYYMPRAGVIEHMLTDDLNVPSPTNALGAKGVGEAGAVGAMPALMNAIVDALRPLGIDHIDMPATPARVWAAIEAARA
jgi:carbon-monoxide dehydrogenase large subunit